MRALTIWQPWATLLVVGLKKYETRPWATGYRGELALHAAKKPVEDALATLPPVLVNHMRNLLADELEDLPTGAVLGTGRLVACHPITRDFLATLPPGEDKLGDFTLGRFAWEFEQLEPLSVPVPARGQQGLWEWRQDPE